MDRDNEAFARKLLEEGDDTEKVVEALMDRGISRKSAERRVEIIQDRIAPGKLSSSHGEDRLVFRLIRVGLRMVNVLLSLAILWLYLPFNALSSVDGMVIGVSLVTIGLSVLRRPSITFQLVLSVLLLMGAGIAYAA